MLKRSLLAAVAALSLAGCASLDNAGHGSANVRAVRDQAGKVAGYELDLKDGKEYASRTVTFKVTPAGAVDLTIVEDQAKAFRGQGIAAKAASVLPTTGLADLLK